MARDQIEYEVLEQVNSVFSTVCATDVQKRRLHLVEQGVGG